METLQPPLGVDEAARGFAERTDRQQHIADVEIGLEGTERNHGLCRLQPLLGRLPCGAIPLGLHLQQDGCLEHALHHLPGIQSAGLRQRAHALRPDGVGGFREVTETCTSLRGNPLRQRQQAGRLRMMRRGIAQQHGLVAAAQQGARYGPCGIRWTGRIYNRRLRACFGRHCGCNVGQCLRPVQCIGLQRRAHRHGPIWLGLRHGADLRALPHGLADTLRKQGMILAQITADDKGAIQCRQLGNRHTQPAHLALGVGTFGLAQAIVDIVAAKRMHELPCQPEFFHRAVRAGKQTHASGTLFFGNVAQTAGRVFKGGLPIDFQPASVLLDHGRREPVGAAERFVAETVTIGDPAFVDRLVFERHHAQHAVVLDLHNQVGSGGIVRADALAPRKLPSARRIAKRFAGERAHRADVDHIARQFRIDRCADKGLDFAVLAAMRHTQFHLPGNFLSKTHTARALDAAVHFLHGNERTRILDREHPFFFLVARTALAIAHRQILQQAFAALVANRAIEWMIDEQELHHTLLRLDCLDALGAHHHAVHHRRGASRNRIGLFFDIHQTHAAVACNRQLLVIAEMGNENAGLFRRLDHHAALWHLDPLAVDVEFDHAKASPAAMGTAQHPCSIW